MTSFSEDPDLPSDNHLRDDISTPTDNPDKAPEQFTPGQTNAGQQVGGLASPSQGPDDLEDVTKNASNNPI
jgi:hypothetical protein